MSRAKWKGPFVNFKRLSKVNEETLRKPIVMTRNSKIIPRFIGLIFKVHNGTAYSEINVTDSMIGHKFGEFSQTRSQFSFKKKSFKK